MFGRMRSSNKIICFIQWGIVILLAAFLVLLAFRNWYCSFDFAKDVSPVDIFSLLFGSLLTLFLGYYITKKLTEQRNEKDFLIEDLKGIETQLIDLQRMLQNRDKLDLQSFSASIETVIQTIERFEQTLRIFGENQDMAGELRKKYFELHTAATNFPGILEPLKNVPVDSIRQTSNNVILEIRKLAHNINKE